MPYTSNYNLYVEDDNTTKFLDWRKQINGSDSSNMTKIDTALSEKAEKSTILTGILYANGWIGDTAPFQQSISIPGLEASANGVISTPHDCTPEQREAVIEAVLYVIEQSDGSLLIEAGKAKPNMDIPVSVMIID